jgi:VanZ family protein
MAKIVRVGIWALRISCAAYWLLLTTLLLVPDPLRLLRMHRVPLDSGSPLVHFAVFVVLSLATLASQFPIPSFVTLAVLAGYAVLTEYLQSYVPPRTMDSLDFVGNFLGILVGAAIYGAGRGLWQRRAQRHRASDTEPGR